MKQIQPQLTPLLITTLLSTSMLLGCGNGDSEDPAPTDRSNTPPVVSITGKNTVVEGQTLTLTANASDADGSISSIKWSTSSADITLIDDQAASVRFIAPAVDSDSELTLDVQVTDNDGATTTESINITVTRITSSVTLSGLVTDDIISNATVEVLVADKIFTTTANSQGQYSVAVTIDGIEQNDHLVQIRATGDTEINPEVEFVSQLGSLNRLIEQAGADNTLVKNESLGVNVTNVSTSEFILLSRDGELPTTNDALDTAKLAIDQNEKLTLSALIKIIVDGEGDNAFSLPEGVDSTLDLIDDALTVDAFIDTVNQHDDSLIADTIRTISNDENLVAPLAIVGSWIFEGSHDLVINFSKSGFYTHMEVSSDDCGQDGFEVGNYIWSPDTGVMSVTTIEDTNGCIGMHDEEPLNQEVVQSGIFTVNGNSMTVTEEHDGETLTFTLTRLISATNPLVGGYFNPTSTGYQILAIFEDNHFLDLGHSQNRYGLNAGTYQWDSSTNLLNYTDIALNQQNVQYSETVAAVHGDIVIWKDDEDAGVMRRTRTTSQQPKLNFDDLAGHTFTGIDNESGWQHDITFNNDNTAQEISNDGIVDFNWQLRFGQLYINEDGWTLVGSPTDISAETLKFDIYDFELDANDNGTEAGFYTISSEIWTKK
ncbi:PKD domain-containing protein [Shewanella woodyi]|uniref:PKD domain-containing protein n=1 Tax=Shewanella woodyi TaxID=60961 RepID=UPI0037487102